MNDLVQAESKRKAEMLRLKEKQKKLADEIAKEKKKVVSLKKTVCRFSNGYENFRSAVLCHNVAQRLSFSSFFWLPQKMLHPL